MVKIHWSFYLILGAGVLWASYKIDPQKFKLFIWLGYVFLAVGVAKLGIWFVKREKESSFERRDVGREMHQRQTRQGAARYCPRCGNALRGHENFCSGCGVQLR
jgi:hypothetical protein